MSAIRFIDEVFEEQFCLFLLNNARARLSDSDEFRRSNFHWDEAIRRSSAVVLVRDYDETLRTLILDRLCERKLIEHRNYSVMNYAWTRLSFIPWHSDANTKEGLTVYLNEEWELDWGGLFLYRNLENDIRAFAPKFNWGLKNDAWVPHSTTPVSLDAPEPRFTLQLFSRE